jgi:predicted transcriptional regulator
MYRLTAEGRIIRSLKDGEKSFSQLLDGTGLSPRWLNVKIKILTGVGLVKRNGRTYTLIGEEQASHPLIEKLIRVSSDLYADPRIIAAILVGGVPKGILSEESDLDIVVIVKEALPIRDVEWML